MTSPVGDRIAAPSRLLFSAPHSGFLSRCRWHTAYDEAKECAGETDVIIYNAAYLDEIGQRGTAKRHSWADPQLKLVIEEIDREFLVLPWTIPDVTGRLPESDSKTFVKARSHL